MSSIGQFLRGAVATGGLVMLAAADLYLLARPQSYQNVRAPTHSGKPCGDLIIQTYNLIDGHYQSSINLATTDGIRPFTFTWAPEREDLTRTVQNAIIERAQERILLRTGQYAQLSLLIEDHPLGWLEVTCEDGKTPCHAKELRRTCWDD